MNKLNIYAAGSLRLAFADLAKLFTQIHPTEIDMQFAPAGLLCEKIIQETAHPFAHLFASANTIYPQNLVIKGLAISQYIFAHNRLCLTVRNQPQWTSYDALTLLLDPNTRIGISTPKKDPSGDYAFALFDKIDSHYQGMGEQLKKRAKQLVGGSLTTSTPTGMLPAEYLLLNNTVDVYIGYANYASKILQNSQLAIIELPIDFNPAINYSIALLNHSHPQAKLFIDFLLSSQGQKCLQRNGYIKKA
ncbi:molybdate ABC transporter substrate-binding protein [uncultured Gilliamella sp.]|uniref:molybdate ABC transporter substrate-binding protein n=1 Tax=uncultured Gilliamella sp. TaxID=1193505 RepID=UPI0025D274D4|nr:molybdate ABC transporter substrate-binding protein [uncultured Gilliamella sp.]